MKLKWPNNKININNKKTSFNKINSIVISFKNYLSGLKVMKAKIYMIQLFKYKIKNKVKIKIKIPINNNKKIMIYYLKIAI